MARQWFAWNIRCWQTAENEESEIVDSSGEQWTEGIVGDKKKNPPHTHTHRKEGKNTVIEKKHQRKKSRTKAIKWICFKNFELLFYVFLFSFLRCCCRCRCSHFYLHSLLSQRVRWSGVLAKYIPTIKKRELNWVFLARFNCNALSNWRRSA